MRIEHGRYIVIEIEDPEELKKQLEEIFAEISRQMLKQKEEPPDAA